MSRHLARTVLLQLVTLCTALGVLWAPVAEAVECSGEADVAGFVEQHGESGGDESTPEKHGTCAHGHCHHTSQAVRDSADFVIHLTAATLLTGIKGLSLDGSRAELATPPPRA